MFGQNAELVAAWAATIGAIIAGISIAVAILQGYTTRRLTLKQISVNSITDKRTSWIGELRSLLGEYWGSTATLCSDLLFTSESMTVLEKNKRLEIIKSQSAKITLYLNFNSDIEKIIINNIRKIDTCLSDMASNPSESIKLQKWNDEIFTGLTNVFACSRVLLKLEWNRIKKEVDNHKYSNSKYNADKIDLLEKYWTETPYKDVINSKELLNMLLNKKE